SLCHGFSATPVYQLSKGVLGIEPVTAGYRRFRLNPQPAGLQWARGAVPTPLGPILVDWQRRGCALELTVEHPDGCRIALSEDLARGLVIEEAGQHGRRLRFELPARWRGSALGPAR